MQHSVIYVGELLYLNLQFDQLPEYLKMSVCVSVVGLAALLMLCLLIPDRTAAALGKHFLKKILTC